MGNGKQIERKGRQLFIQQILLSLLSFQPEILSLGGLLEWLTSQEMII